MNELEKAIVELLAEGYIQKEIHCILIERDICPNSVPQIEKTIKAIKNRYGAKSLFQLAVKLERAKK
jgi:hypothetical protein